MAAVKDRRRFAWILLSQNAQSRSFDSSVLVMGFENDNSLESFTNAKCVDSSEEALQAAVGIKCEIVIVGPEGKIPSDLQKAIPVTPMTIPKKAHSDLEVLLGQTALLLHEQRHSRIAALMPRRREN